mmetsp:Transcript_33137/g.104942  ORF Transcript_33137/g.104942 Transcript_33137/m.104942 type:complete len:213 (-) Transcript_33137:1051-1689(-)
MRPPSAAASSPPLQTRTGRVVLRLLAVTATGAPPACSRPPQASSTRCSHANDPKASLRSNRFQKHELLPRPNTSGEKWPATSLWPGPRNAGPCTMRRCSSSTPSRKLPPPICKRKRGSTSPAREVPLHRISGAACAGLGVPAPACLGVSAPACLGVAAPVVAGPAGGAREAVCACAAAAATAARAGLRSASRASASLRTEPLRSKRNWMMGV